MKPAMVRSIDSQGRFIIPTEIRKTMDLTEGDILEIRTFSNGIFLSKYTAQIHDPDMKKYLEILYSVIRCSTAICSKDQVLAAKGTGLREGTSLCPVSRADTEPTAHRMQRTRLHNGIQELSRGYADSHDCSWLLKPAYGTAAF